MDEWDLPQWKKEVESLKYQLAYWASVQTPPALELKRLKLLKQTPWTGLPPAARCSSRRRGLGHPTS
uniref:Uncharacterized protein n=1 Tax=Bubo bubo TaxID=30461 RepID=A0A8C0ID39_BUBBB